MQENKPIPTAYGPLDLSILKGMARDRSLLTAMEAMHGGLGDIFQITMPRFQPVVVSGPELNRQVMVTDRDKFSWRGEKDPVVKLLRHGLLVEDGQEHNRLRACMEPALRRDQLLTMLIAGHDTSTAMLAWALYLMGENPDVMAAAETEALNLQFGLPNGGQFPYLDQVIKETLRLFPPIHVGNRFAADDVQLGEYEVPQGSRVMVSFYLTHRDETVWKEAEQFCPHRFDRSHQAEAGQKRPSLSFVPFGGGPRNCIGATFAQIEGRVVLALSLSILPLLARAERAYRKMPQMPLPEPVEGLPSLSIIVPARNEAHNLRRLQPSSYWSLPYGA